MEKSTKIIEAATDTFIRFGFRKTTLGDIAEAADMSRPALYQCFSNKEDIFLAVVEEYFSSMYNAAEQQLAKTSTVEARLNVVFDNWIIVPYKLISKSSSANELYELAYGFAAGVIDKQQDRLREQLSVAVSGADDYAEASLATHNLTLQQFCRLVSLTSTSLKREVTSLKQLRELLNIYLKIHLPMVT